MARPLKIAKSSTIDIGFPNDGTSDNGFTGNGIGVVGGDNVSLNVLVRVKIGANAEADGYILRQKGKRKFLVTDGTNTGICVLADSIDTELADDTMTVTVIDDAAATLRLSTITNHWGLDFNETKYVLSFFTTAAAGAVLGTDYAQVAVRNNS